jgi:hypothetical protein
MLTHIKGICSHFVLSLAVAAATVELTEVLNIEGVDNNLNTSSVISW